MFSGSACNWTQNSFGLLRGGHRGDQGAAKSELQLHLNPRVRDSVGLKPDQRAFAALATFGHERQVPPDRRERGRQLLIR